MKISTLKKTVLSSLLTFNSYGFFLPNNTYHNLKNTYCSSKDEDNRFFSYGHSHEKIQIYLDRKAPTDEPLTYIGDESPSGQHKFYFISPTSQRKYISETRFYLDIKVMGFAHQAIYTVYETRTFCYDLSD